MSTDIRIKRVDPTIIEDLKILANELGYPTYQELLRNEIQTLVKNRQATNESFEKFSKKIDEFKSEILKSNSETQTLIGKLILITEENFGI